VRDEGGCVGVRRCHRHDHAGVDSDCVSGRVHRGCVAIPASLCGGDGPDLARSSVSLCPPATPVPPVRSAGCRCSFSRLVEGAGAGTLHWPTRAGSAGHSGQQDGGGVTGWRQPGQSEHLPSPHPPALIPLAELRVGVENHPVLDVPAPGKAGIHSAPGFGTGVSRHSTSSTGRTGCRRQNGPPTDHTSTTRVTTCPTSWKSSYTSAIARRYRSNRGSPERAASG